MRRLLQIVAVLASEQTETAALLNEIEAARKKPARTKGIVVDFMRRLGA